MSAGCCGGLDIFVPNEICGFEAHFGDISVVGPELFLTFWRSLGGSLGEHVVFLKKHVFGQNRQEKRKKCVSLSNNAISNPLVTKVIWAC